MRAGGREVGREEAKRKGGRQDVEKEKGGDEKEGGRRKTKTLTTKGLNLVSPEVGPSSFTTSKIKIYEGALPPPTPTTNKAKVNKTKTRQYIKYE